MSESFLCLSDDLQQYLGWYLAADIRNPLNGLLLIRRNAVVTEKLLQRLPKWEVGAVYVSPKPVDEDQESDERAKALAYAQRSKSALKRAFGDVLERAKYHRKGATGTYSRTMKYSKLLDKKQLQEVTSTIEKVIEIMLSNPTAALYVGLMSDLEPYLLRHGVNVTYMALTMLARCEKLRESLSDPEKGLMRYEVGKVHGSLDMKSLGISCLLADIGSLFLLRAVDKKVVYPPEHNIWIEIKKHPNTAYDLLSGRGINRHSLLGIKYHHENMDGSGYHYGVKGYKIHPYSRIIRVVDSFDAAIQDRPGSPAKAPEDVLRELESMAGPIYDPEIVKSFVAMVSDAEEL